jgi:hypothetical protein
MRTHKRKRIFSSTAENSYNDSRPPKKNYRSRYSGMTLKKLLKVLIDPSDQYWAVDEFVSELTRYTQNISSQHRDYPKIQQQLTASANFYLINKEYLYLKKTPTQLIHLANQLSNCTSSTCEQASTDIAMLCDLDHFGGFTSKYLGLLANACSQWPESKDAEAGVQRIAKYLYESKDLENILDNNGQAISLIANGCSKWPENSHCQKTVGLIGEYVADEFLENFEWQHLCNLANAFSKWPKNEGGQEGMFAIAEFAAEQELSLQHFHLSILANACSKWPENEDCAYVLKRIARRVDKPLSSFDISHLSTLTNAFSKLPENKDCEKATLNLLTEIKKKKLSSFDAKGITVLANAWSKWLNNKECEEGVIEIAKYITQKNDLSEFSVRQLTILSNAFSKYNNNQTCKEVIYEIAKTPKIKKLSALSLKQRSMLANAFSKCSHNKNCKNFIINLAKRESKTDLSKYSDKNFSNIANAYSKYPKNNKCKTAAKKIARKIVEMDLEKFKNEAVISLANSYSKWPNDKDCKAALHHTAVSFCKRNTSKITQLGVVNMANACSKQPENENCKKAMSLINQDLPRRKLSHFGVEDLAIMANACSKWPDDKQCIDSMKSLTREFSRRNLSAADDKTFATMANACSKWPDSDFSKAIIVKIAREVSQYNLTDFYNTGLALISNASSKWSNEEDCKNVIENIAHKISQEDLTDFDSFELVTLANAFSKFPSSEICQHAIKNIAKHSVTVDSDRLDSRELNTMANAFSKWPANEDCKNAITHITRNIITRNLADFEIFQLSSIANACSKWPENDDCKKSLFHVVREIIKRDLPHSDPLSSIANAACKYPENEDCQRVVVKIAKQIMNMEQPNFESRDYSNLANAFSKWPEDKDCEAAVIHMARKIVTLDLADFGSQEIGLVANACSKWPNDIDCKAVIEHIAQKMAQQDLTLLENQCITILAGSAIKCRDSEDCISMMQHIATFLAKTTDMSHITSRLTDRALSILGNALGYFYQSSHELNSTVYLQALSAISQYTQKNHLTLEGWGVSRISLLLRGFARAEMLQAIDALAPACLEQLTKQLGDEKTITNLQVNTLGTLCMALIPSLSSIDLYCYRAQTIKFLLDLKPVIEKKLELFNQSFSKDDLSETDNLFRRLSLYQILKGYTVLSRQMSGEHQELDNWIKQLHTQLRKAPDHRNLLKASGKFLTKYSQNLLADLEIDDLPDSVDRMVARHMEEIVQSDRAAAFDINEIFSELDQHSPEPPRNQTGLYAMPQCDVNGNWIKSEKLTYSILSHLTGNTIHPVWVKLPPMVNSRLLGRTIIYQGRQYRFDLFGGSRMKAHRLDIGDLIAGKNNMPTQGGQLLGIPLIDTLPDTDFERLVQRLFPFKESFYYFQRAMLAAPLELPKLEPHDHVLAGQFNIGILPDRKAGEPHSFRIFDEEKRIINLRPHDGAGFIKASLLEKMGWYKKLNPKKLPQPFGGDSPQANLPADALQHYPANQAVEEEFIEKLQQRHGDKTNSEELFRDITAAGAKGHMGIAVPSADDRLYLPTCKMKIPAPVLLGRAPYDKPNLRPIEAARVITTHEKDATAQFLDTCWGVQYTLVAQRQFLQDQQNAAALFFAKGVLIVLKDSLWPEEFKDQNLILSAQDPKTDSTWMLGRQRMTEDTRLKAPGILTLTNVYSPGSLIAPPIPDQEALDGDYDGDVDLILCGYDRFFKHVQQFDLKNLTESLKPKKTHTPAFIMSDNDRYQFGRTSQILDTQNKVLETFIVLQRTFLSQPMEKQTNLAQAICFEVFEGIEEKTQEALANLLVSPSLRQDDICQLKETILLRLKDQEIHPVLAFLLNDLLKTLTDLAEYKIDSTASRSAKIPLSVAGLLMAIRPDWQKQHEILGKNLRGSLQLAVRQIPVRFLLKEKPVYLPADDLQTVKNLLSLGIKIGTDSFKSNTGIAVYQKIMVQIKKVLISHGIEMGVCYSKRVARQLATGKFNPELAKKALSNNPTLAATIMTQAIDELTRQNRLTVTPVKLNPPAPATKRPVLGMAARRMLKHYLPSKKRKEPPATDLTLSLTRAPKKAQHTLEEKRREKESSSPTTGTIAFFSSNKSNGSSVLPELRMKK